MKALKEVHLLITGRVQGVAFRYHTAEQAQALGLRGWVRNLPDGRVEARAQGDEHTLKHFIDICRQGPRLARVDDIDVNWNDEPSACDGFTIRY